MNEQDKQADYVAKKRKFKAQRQREEEHAMRMFRYFYLLVSVVMTLGGMIATWALWVFETDSSTGELVRWLALACVAPAPLAGALTFAFFVWVEVQERRAADGGWRGGDARGVDAVRGGGAMTWDEALYPSLEGLRARRIALGLRQDIVAHALGRTVGYVSQIERRVVRIPIHHAPALARVLRLDPALVTATLPHEHSLRGYPQVPTLSIVAESVAASLTPGMLAQGDVRVYPCSLNELHRAGSARGGEWSFHPAEPPDLSRCGVERRIHALDAPHEACAGDGWVSLRKDVSARLEEGCRRARYILARHMAHALLHAPQHGEELHSIFTRCAPPPPEGWHPYESARHQAHAWAAGMLAPYPACERFARASTLRGEVATEARMARCFRVPLQVARDRMAATVTRGLQLERRGHA